MEQKSKDPLHGKRLDAILEELEEYYEGFEALGEQTGFLAVQLEKAQTVLLAQHPRGDPR